MRRIQVDFGKILREWDGFGINYVEAAQTRDYNADPQEYGGFCTLTEAERQTSLQDVRNLLSSPCADVVQLSIGDGSGPLRSKDGEKMPVPIVKCCSRGTVDADGTHVLVTHVHRSDQE